MVIKRWNEISEEIQEKIINEIYKNHPSYLTLSKEECEQLAIEKMVEKDISLLGSENESYLYNIYHKELMAAKTIRLWELWYESYYLEKEKEMELVKKRREIKKIIEQSGAKFMTVEFKKKDGTQRRMRIQQAMLKDNLAESPTESQIKATETRKKNNPHLFNVFDFDTKGIRSINLDTVTQINANGIEYRFK